ncbi:hypothetical protein N2603_38040 [Bradyrhizobium huanghuaihaiense]|uniref:hypothetical protein n=1 Tax=Bradyrhizobium huanghuaihaiense TaxID=990078 RepID=UPI0021AA3DC2|nr:hypothetical protein [Bradyrhizobium sp. CB3035]UWU75734.1 hypothetical protein N2603_38040 [Bradyrhizobium sp. CB3035]
MSRESRARLPHRLKMWLQICAQGSRGDAPDDCPHNDTIIALEALLEDDDKDFTQQAPIFRIAHVAWRGAPDSKMSAAGTIFATWHAKPQTAVYRKA